MDVNELTMFELLEISLVHEWNILQPFLSYSLRLILPEENFDNFF